MQPRAGSVRIACHAPRIYDEMSSLIDTRRRLERQARLLGACVSRILRPTTEARAA